VTAGAAAASDSRGVGARGSGGGSVEVSGATGLSPEVGTRPPRLLMNSPDIDPRGRPTEAPACLMAAMSSSIDA
jgi:hypothetical protein